MLSIWIRHSAQKSNNPHNSLLLGIFIVVNLQGKFRSSYYNNDPTHSLTARWEKNHASFWIKEPGLSIQVMVHKLIPTIEWTQLIGSKKNPRLLKKRFKLTVTLTKITVLSQMLKYRPWWRIGSQLNQKPSSKSASNRWEANLRTKMLGLGKLVMKLISSWMPRRGLVQSFVIWV